MFDIDILKAMINNTAIVSLARHHYSDSKWKVILAEPACPEKSVTINGMPNDAEVIVIKADMFASPSSIFIGSKGECKRADFIIVANTDKKKVIVCIEMKAKVKTSPESEIIQQLKGAKCFIEYCKEIGKLFWDERNFLEDYCYRFVTIRNISISKKGSRLTSKLGHHDRPERMLKISSPHNLQFDHLTGAG